MPVSAEAAARRWPRAVVPERTRPRSSRRARRRRRAAPRALESLRPNWGRAAAVSVPGAAWDASRERRRVDRWARWRTWERFPDRTPVLHRSPLVLLRVRHVTAEDGRRRRVPWVHEDRGRNSFFAHPGRAGVPAVRAVSHRIRRQCSRGGHARVMARCRVSRRPFRGCEGTLCETLAPAAVQWLAATSPRGSRRATLFPPGSPARAQSTRRQRALGTPVGSALTTAVAAAFAPH